MDSLSTTPEDDPDTFARRAVCDVNNSITFKAVGHLNGRGSLVAPTIMPRGKVWISVAGDSKLRANHTDSGIHRLICGTEALELLGWPAADVRFRPLISDTPQSLLHDLAGNAFSTTVLSAIVVALIFSIKSFGHDTVDAASKEEVADAIRLLKRARQQ